jgi:DNA-binding NarL/FixJ family response regulator
MMKNNITVLVVDDSPLVAPRVKSLLKNWEDTIVIGEAFSADEARTYLEDMTPDVILLDLNIAGKSGLDLLKEIKQSHPEITVIMFTNHSEPYYRNICKQFGADHFIDKSIEFDLLPYTIHVLAGESLLAC